MLSYARRWEYAHASTASVGPLMREKEAAITVTRPNFVALVTGAALAVAALSGCGGGSQPTDRAQRDSGTPATGQAAASGAATVTIGLSEPTFVIPSMANE